jgi:branched-chain amino acid transport system ATP-binding protein
MSINEPAAVSNGIPHGPDLALGAYEVCVRYGSVQAVQSVTIELPRGQVRALIGSNGAGKTSLLRAICGLTSTWQGRIEVGGTEVTGMRTEQRAERGLTLVPEGRGVFTSMSVEDNLVVAGGRDRQTRQRVDELLAAFPLLAKLRKRRAGLLSGGEQQILALARALMRNPLALLLDEPSMGLSPIAVRSVLEALRTLASSGPGLLLVEQNARLALNLADYVYVMQHGRIVAAGSGVEVAGDEAVRLAYLGAPGGGRGA